MTDNTEELYLNDLDSSLEKLWELLSAGKKDRNSPLHTLAIDTVDPKGQPSQRIMVLREIDRENRLLRFNTDSRASKIADIGTGNPVSILCYHPEAKIQLRLTGAGRTETNSPVADEAWNRASPYGKRCYLADPAPGTRTDIPTSGLDPDIEGRKPSDQDVAPARANFAILLVEIERIEWLYLAHTGHRRAEFCWNTDSGMWDSNWLIP